MTSLTRIQDCFARGRGVLLECLSFDNAIIGATARLTLDVTHRLVVRPPQRCSVLRPPKAAVRKRRKKFTHSNRVFTDGKLFAGDPSLNLTREIRAANVVLSRTSSSPALGVFVMTYPYLLGLNAPPSPQQAMLEQIALLG